MILEYNRYPDIVRQVSIIQYPTFHRIYDLRPYFAKRYGALSERVTLQPFSRNQSRTVSFYEAEILVNEEVVI